MKKIFILTAITLIIQAAPVLAATINVKVNGLVCDFCAQSIKKTLGKQDSISDVKVDLDAGSITIATKEGTALDDATITKLITDSGYTVTAIERTP